MLLVFFVDKVHFFKLPSGLRTPKLFGAFLAVVALLLFFQSGALMFETWENLKLVNSCYSSAQALPSFSEDCRALAKDLLGLSVRPDQVSLGIRQMFIAFVGPLASMFFWIIVFLAGIGLYESGKIINPIQQSVRQMKKGKE